MKARLEIGELPRGSMGVTLGLSFSWLPSPQLQGLGWQQTRRVLFGLETACGQALAPQEREHTLSAILHDKEKNALSLL